MLQLFIRIIEDFVSTNLNVKVFQSVLLLYFLDLASEKQPFVVKIKNLWYLNYYISERFIQYLLVSSNETIDDFFVFKTESNKDFELLIFTSLFILDLHSEMLINRLYQSIFVLTMNSGIYFIGNLLFNCLGILHYYLEFISIWSTLGISSSVSSSAALSLRSSSRLLCKCCVLRLSEDEF